MRFSGTRAAVVLICAAVFLPYFNSLSDGFAGDARGLVLQDPRVRDASSENLGNIFVHTYWWPYGESGLYRPVTTLSYLFNYAILGNGTDAAGYHWTNLLLHLLNALLLYGVARRFTASMPAAMIAALWAVHPVLTESVTSIAGRPDLIAGACVLGGLLLYWKGSESSGGRRAMWLCALAVVTLTGALSKEIVVVLPGIVLLYEILWRRERKGADLIWSMVAMIAPIQVMLYLRAAALFPLPPMQFPFWDNPIAGSGFWTGRATALGVMARYLSLLVWPARLSSDYSWAQIRPGDGALLGILATLAVAAGLALLWRRSRVGFFATTSVILLWLPSANLLFPIGTIMAERFLYLPAIAFASGVVWAATKLRSQRAAYAIVGLLALAFAARTWARNRDWQSDLTLAESAVRNSPASYKSHKLLANALFESHAPIDRVLEEAEKSVAILDPLEPLRNNADTWRRAALWYESKGDEPSLKRALQLLDRCRTIIAAQAAEARRNPLATEATDPILAGPGEVDRLIAALQVRMGNPGAAMEALTRGVEQEPENAEAWSQYADALAASGRRDDAVVAAMEGVMLTVDPALRQRVVELYRAGGAAAGCALLPGQNGSVAINPACPAVRQQLCTAAARAIAVRRKSGRQDLAEQLRGSGVRDFGCDPKTLE